MEALLEREGDVDSWNDERLDELSRRIDAGFNEMRKGFSRIEQGMKGLATRKEVQAVVHRVEAVDDRIFKLMIMMLVFCGGLVTTLLAVALGMGGS
jgi:hypothetical protein